MNEGEEIEITNHKKNLTYQNMFYLFMIANVVGVILEGIWTIYKFGRWETHTITVWGPFCLIYGAGAVTFYVGSTLFRKKNIVLQFLLYACIANTVEYISAWVIEDGLGLRAWTYKKHFMNLQGRISLQMTIIWGVIGILFSKALVPQIDRLFKKLQGKIWKYVCIGLTIFMVINLSMTTLCLIRWSDRHKGKAATNQLERYLDTNYDDERMKNTFCEWWFIDEQKEFWKEYKNR
ncbi:putative ABC transporter permease [Anaerosporobacter faecicola]|uniref:putative ABC transporter permease n=1 Tax=Anaerosporobacter faecicola TaxID=2718714 RepID=UPI001EE5136E|nr:putative ABC transporter permease [Anaerosporobacter faecicola]